MNIVKKKSGGGDSRNDLLHPLLLRLLTKSPGYYCCLVVVVFWLLFHALLVPWLVMVYQIPRDYHDNANVNINLAFPSISGFQRVSSTTNYKTKNTKDDVDDSSSSSLFRLRAPLDYERYTVRVNTWKRQPQLKIVLRHLLTCDSVAQIQVVWCTAQGPVPDWIGQLDDNKKNHHNRSRIMVEEHEENSLNARFDMLLEAPTSGILSQDDDILRPCVAMDAGFAIWTKNPHRMVGFDARSHGVGIDNDKNNNNNDHHHHDKKWTYAFLSETTATNKYSLSLSRFCFLHKHYLKTYTTTMPTVIRQTVTQHLNCEDIAMSLWVSAQTKARPPLLADVWAMETRFKLPSDNAISLTSADHKQIRDNCVHDFSVLLQLHDRLEHAEWIHHTKKRDDDNGQDSSLSLLQCGILPDHALEEMPSSSSSIVSSHVTKLLAFRKRFAKKRHRSLKNKIEKMTHAFIQAIQREAIHHRMGLVG